MLMLSVPPARTTAAEPPRMRSAAKAMACRPEAQNRFTVAAEASTGIPARRLAMRATFNPCSASGIAQPRITSSTSAGEMPGARDNAAFSAVAASSSGRVARSAPKGALPTAVRAAERITASAIVVLKKIDDRLADLGHLAVKQMIGAVNHDELLGLGEPPVEFPHVFQRHDLIEFTMNEKNGLGRFNHR